MLKTEFRVTSLVRTIRKGDDYTPDAETNPAFERIDCGLGHSPFGYPPEVETAKARLTTDDLVQYLNKDAYGKSLAQPIRERFGLGADVEVFSNGSGSYGLLAAILSDLVSREAISKGLEVMGFGPQFTNIDMLARRAEIPYSPIAVPLAATTQFKLDTLIEHRLKASKPAIIYLDNPNNPTGDVLSLSAVQALADATQRQDLLIIDEAYGDLVDDAVSAIPLTVRYPHIIALRSLSKGIGLASPRLGYAIMSEPLAAIYKNIELVFAVDTFTILVANAALNPNVLATFLPDVRRQTAEIKSELVAGLIQLGVKVFPTHPTVSIFMAQNPGKFYQDLLNYGIATEDGQTFKPTHPEMNSSLVRFRIPGDSSTVSEIHQRVEDLQKAKRK
jgi:histidinol-phosphate aminotransferase